KKRLAYSIRIGQSAHQDLAIRRNRHVLDRVRVVAVGHVEGDDSAQTKGRIETAVRIEAIQFHGTVGTGHDDAAIGLNGDRGYDGQVVERLVAGASGEGLIQAAVRVVACDHV